jgi:dTDP-4-amino-4,6-dideoxygalactose transaminase
MTMDTRRAIERVSNYLCEFLADPSAFRGQQMRGGGPVADFEELLAARCGFPYCVATCNATTALMGLAIMLGMRGRSVWFPKPHWEGSVSAMRCMGARIHRYDPQATSRFRGFKHGDVVIVSEVADVGVLRRRAGLPDFMLIEDSSRLPWLATGNANYSPADIQVLSFGPGKALSLAEGGAALFRSAKHYQQFIKHSMHPERFAALQAIGPQLPLEAFNARIHPVAAILGIELLKQVPSCI